MNLEVITAEERIELGVPGQRQRAGLYHQVVDADAVFGICLVVDVAAQGHGLAHIDLGGDVEVWGTGFAVGSDSGDGLPHAAELDAGVGRGGHKLRCGRRSWRGFRGCGSGLVVLDVALGDTAVGPGASHQRKVDAAFSGQTAGDGRSADLAVGSRRWGCGRRRLCGCRGRRRGGGRRRAWGGRSDFGDRFAGLGDDGDQLTHRHGYSGFGYDAAQDPAGIGLEFDRGLVRLDVGDDLAAVDGVALLLVPADDGPFPHIVSHLGHDDVGSHDILLSVSGLEGYLRAEASVKIRRR